MKLDNKNYKDSLFRLLFNNKDHLLELYNAINQTSYSNPDDLTIKTLKGRTFLGMRNDVSFIIDDELNLYEHNSTPCPNIALRDLLYIASTYHKMFPKRKLFEDNVIEIPAPRFYVFYNGNVPLPDKTQYKLSDMFIKKNSTPSLELVVDVYNVNEGKNMSLMNASKTLKGYSIFVGKVRKYTKQAQLAHSKADYEKNKKEIIRKSVTQAIDECIKEGILKDFFIKNREEAIEMSIFECTFEEQLQYVADGKYEKGLKDGKAQGISQGISDTNSLYSWLYSKGRLADLEKAFSDPKYRDKLFKEYNAQNKNK